MSKNPRRSRKGATSSSGTKKHLVPGLENQVGAALSAARDTKNFNTPTGESPDEIRWLGQPGREREEFRKLQQLGLEEQVKMAVVGEEKFHGMGPGCVFDVVDRRELDGEECYTKLKELEEKYARYIRWDKKDQRDKPIIMPKPVEYRTISIPDFRSRAFQRGLKEGIIKPAKFRRLLRGLSQVLQKEFRRATKYKGAKAGLEVEMVLWHLQQNVMHCHLIVRKCDGAGARLGLIGVNGRLVWNELEMSLIAERRRRALDFQPIPKVMKNGQIIGDWSLLDRWTRSRMEGDDKSGNSRRARDLGLLDTWDMQLNDVVDSVLETFAQKNARLWEIFQEEEKTARNQNQAEYALFRQNLGLARRNELDQQLAETKKLLKETKTAHIVASKRVTELETSLEKLTKKLSNLEMQQNHSANLEASLAVLRDQTELLNVQLRQKIAESNEIEARLKAVEASPVLLLKDQRSRLIAMSDALHHVLNGIAPTHLDLMFLQPCDSHIGGYRLLPVFIEEARSTMKPKSAAEAARDVLMLDQINSFTEFEFATNAFTKFKQGQSLLEHERKYLDDEGRPKKIVIAAAECAIRVGRKITFAETALYPSMKQRQTEASELIATVKAPQDESSALEQESEILRQDFEH